jgi:hypothetical protein
MTKRFFDCGPFFASPDVSFPGGFRRADAVRRSISPARSAAKNKNGFRRPMSKPTPGDTPTPRHSGLDPESRIVFIRREAPLKFECRTGFRVKPGMTTHFFDGGPFFASPGVSFAGRFS